MPYPSAMPSRPAVAPPAIPSLEAQVAGLDLLRCVSRRRLLRLEPGAEPSLAFLHLQPDAEALRNALGLAPGSDLARHFAEVIAMRLRDALRDPSHAVRPAGGSWVADQPSPQSAGLGFEASLHTARPAAGSRVADQPSPQGADLGAEASLHAARPAEEPSRQGSGLGAEAPLRTARLAAGSWAIDQQSRQGAGLDAGGPLHAARLAAGDAPTLCGAGLVAARSLLWDAPGDPARATAPTGADWATHSAALRSAGWNAEVRLLMDAPRVARLTGGTGPMLVGAGLVAEAPLLVELPARAVLAGTLPHGLAASHVAALPLVSAADPGAFADLAAQARLAGWGVALCGLTASTLAWLRPHPISADWFILRWSEALREGAALASLHRLDPDRIILTGCDTDAALEWGQSLQIRVFGGAALSFSAAGAIA